MDLTDAYEIGAHTPDGPSYFTRWDAAATAFRAACGVRFEAGFDPETRRGADVFWPDGTLKGLMVFVHGGYWMRTSPRDWSHLAAGAVARGWAVALPGYVQAPNIRVSGITAIVAETISELAGRVEGPIALAGHSAGGHLVARMVGPDVLPADVAARIDRVAPISPLSNLSPLLRTQMNETLDLTPREVQLESPVTQPRPDAGVRIWVGALERPALLDQTRWLSEAWDVPSVVVPDRHHFDVIEALEDPRSEMLDWLLAEG